MPKVRAVLDQVGLEKWVSWTGCEDADRALQVKRGIFNSASHLGVSAQVEVEQDGPTFTVKFVLHDKRSARARHVQRYGTDRSKWPYNPRSKG